MVLQDRKAERATEAVLKEKAGCTITFNPARSRRHSNEIFEAFDVLALHPDLVWVVQVFGSETPKTRQRTVTDKRRTIEATPIPKPLVATGALRCSVFEAREEVVNPPDAAWYKDHYFREHRLRVGNDVEWAWTVLDEWWKVPDEAT